MKSDLQLPKTLSSALVFAHADADGHLAAEQTRGWFARQGVSVTTVVSPETRNYHFWSKLSKFDFSKHDLVAIVDIAFRFRDPRESLSRLLEVTDCNPEKQFVVVDHHHLLAPEVARHNLQLIEVADPYDCCLGVPDPELMQVAALCDGAWTAVVPTPTLEKRALGVKRAAADIMGVAGDGLLELIRDRNWDYFEALAEEDSEMHRSVRGRRHDSSKHSPLIEYARSHFPSASAR